MRNVVRMHECHSISSLGAESQRIVDQQGLADLTIADRATLGNMSPEFGSTAAMFPIDEVTIVWPSTFMV